MLGFIRSCPTLLFPLYQVIVGAGRPLVGQTSAAESPLATKSDVVSNRIIGFSIYLQPMEIHINVQW